MRTLRPDTTYHPFHLVDGGTYMNHGGDEVKVTQVERFAFPYPFTDEQGRRYTYNGVCELSDIRLRLLKMA